MKYYLYILHSLPAKRYYIGYSHDPATRLHFHNTAEKGFTARYRPWELIFQYEFATEKEAKEAERKVKSWKSRSMIEKLIRQEIHF